MSLGDIGSFYLAGCTLELFTHAGSTRRSAERRTGAEVKCKDPTAGFLYAVTLSGRLALLPALMPTRPLLSFLRNIAALASEFSARVLLWLIRRECFSAPRALEEHDVGELVELVA